MRIYFDVCALNRLTDDQSQPRIRDEAEAVQEAFRLIRLGIHEWISSPAVLIEVRANPDEDRRSDTLGLLRRAQTVQPLTPAVQQRAIQFRSFGIGAMDAVHLAAALEAECDALLTTDDRFIRAAAKAPSVPTNFVRNPIDL